MKILILCPTGLGNIILFLPAYRALRSQLPRAKVTVALDSRWYGDPFFQCQFGDDIELVCFAAKAEGYIAIARTVRDLRRRHFDVVLMPHCGPSWKLGVLLLSIGAKRTISFQTGWPWWDRRFDVCVPIVEGEHYLERNLRQIHVLGVDGEIPDSWVEAPEQMVSQLQREKAGLVWIGIHPGVNADFNVARQWPMAHSSALIERIVTEPDRKVILFGRGQEERSSIDALIERRESRCVSVLDRPLDQVAAYLRACDVFVGNDSGMMNLAVALGVPTVGILGPTDPRHTGPYGSRHRIVRLDLPCSPCFDQGRSLGCPHRRCLADLKPDRVWTAIQELLSQIPDR